jgi:hypothetical protein
MNEHIRSKTLNLPSGMLGPQIEEGGWTEKRKKNSSKLRGPSPNVQHRRVREHYKPNELGRVQGKLAQHRALSLVNLKNAPWQHLLNLRMFKLF